MFYNQLLVWPPPIQSEWTYRGWRWNLPETHVYQAEEGLLWAPGGGSSGPVLGARGAAHAGLRCCRNPRGATCLMQPRHQDRASAGLSPLQGGNCSPRCWAASPGRGRSPPGALGGAGLLLHLQVLGVAELPRPWTSRPPGVSSHGGIELMRPLGPACLHHLGNWSPKARKSH